MATSRQQQGRTRSGLHAIESNTLQLYLLVDDCSVQDAMQGYSPVSTSFLVCDVPHVCLV